MAHPRFHAGRTVLIFSKNLTMADGISPTFAGLNSHEIVQSLLDVIDIDASVFGEVPVFVSCDSGVSNLTPRNGQIDINAVVV